MAYDDLGATQILIRGFEPLEHALAYGALIRRRHEFVTGRERAQVAAE